MIRRRASLDVALLALTAALVLTGWNAAKETEGHFVYAQDDPYIHLTLARTLANDGVWGLSKEAPAAASSSPGWTLLLAFLHRLGADAVWWPFIINVAAAIVVVIMAEKYLPRTLPETARVVALLAFVFVLPLPTLVFIGMEHTLHIACVLTFCCSAATRLASDDQRDGVWIGGTLLAIAVASLRYEGLFVVAVVAALAWIRHRRVLAISLVAAAALPVIAYAAYSLSHGSWILPNSVVIKSGAATFGSSGAARLIGSWTGIFSLYQRPPQLALVLGGAGLAALSADRGRRFWTVSHLLIAIFLGVETLHVCFVNIEWFYRYEAYAVALGSMAVIAALADLHVAGRLSAWLVDGTRARKAATVVTVVVLALPLVVRGLFAVTSTSVACGEVYRQQVQMGRFFRDHYAGETIAINDIGAVSWMAPVRIVDLVGLASNEVAHARRYRRVDATFVRELATRQNVQVAAIYEPHFRTMRELPAEWIKVGEWSMPRVLAVGGATVAFFAPTGAQVDRARRSLDEFSRGLPRGVTYVSMQRRVSN